MSNNPKVPLKAGKYILEVTDFSQSVERHNGRPTPYFQLRFENEQGFVYQKFHNTEYGRLIMDALFRRFGILPHTDQTIHLKEVFEWFVGRYVSLEVYIEDNGERATMGWKAVQPNYRMPLTKIELNYKNNHQHKTNKYKNGQ